VLWQRTFQPRKPGRGSGAIGPPVVYENVLAVSLNDGTIWAMNRNDGSVLWKAPSLIATDNDDVRPLTLFRNLVVAGSVTMAVYAYDMRTGEIRWHVNPDLKGSIFGWMSADDRELFAVTSARLSRIDTTGAILGTIGSPDEKLCFLNGVELDRDVVYVNGCKAFFAIKRSMINEPPFP
jgi:outer membrane protein assembly factor BamB